MLSIENQYQLQKEKKRLDEVVEWLICLFFHNFSNMGYKKYCMSMNNNFLTCKYYINFFGDNNKLAGERREIVTNLYQSNGIFVRKWYRSLLEFELGSAIFHSELTKREVCLFVCFKSS